MPGRTTNDQAVLYKNLLNSYYRCIKNKPKTKKSNFHLYHESNILKLAKSIHNKSYRPSKSSVFVVVTPKPREVIAAHLRDRIVHHYLYEYLNSFWNSRFVKNSYACRKGAGPLQAVKDLEVFLKRHKRASSKPLYYLKLDVQSFFASIDINILETIFERKLHNEDMKWLLKTVLRHRPTRPGEYILKSPKESWQLVPPYKSLFNSPDHIGLPIGNLTSQFFANVYLNELDQYIKHKLAKKHGILFWQRYVDDLLLIGDDQRLLAKITSEVQGFLKRELNLSLNYKKICLQPVGLGIDHLGFFVKPSYTLVRKSVVSRFKSKIAWLEKHSSRMTPVAILSSVNSSFGYFRNAKSLGLRMASARRILANNQLGKNLQVKQDSKKDSIKFKSMELRPPEKAVNHAIEMILKRSFMEMIRAHTRPRTLLKKLLKNWRPMAEMISEARIYCLRRPL